MKKLVTILVVLGLAGFASGANILNVNEDFEGWGAPSTRVVGGVYSWYTGLHGDAFGVGPGLGPLQTFPSGSPAGTSCAGGTGSAGRYGSALDFDAVSTGIVEINLDVRAGKAYASAGDETNRGWVWLQGRGSDTNEYVEIYYYNQQATLNVILKGNGMDTTIAAPVFPVDNWHRTKFQLNLSTGQMDIDWIDINDSTGAEIGGWSSMYSGDMPIDSFDYLELATWAQGYLGGGPNYIRQFDNLVVTPEPVTLGLLALGAGLFLMRRRR